MYSGGTMRIYKEVFSANLKQAIQESGLTQGAVALAAGVTDAMISDYLRGRFTPRTVTVIKLARALKVEPIWLSGELEKWPSTPNFRFPQKIDRNKLVLLATTYANELVRILQIDELQEDSLTVLLVTLASLNPEGLDKVISYTNDLVKITEYTNQKIDK